MTTARLIAALVLLTFSAHTKAQSTDEDFGHWAFAPFFGTGWYTVANDVDVFVLNYAPRWNLRDTSLGENRKRTPGVILTVPISLGLYEFDLEDVPGIVDADNLSTLSVIPGIEIEIPVNERWHLRPLGYVGWGTEFNSGESAWSYKFGVKSRYAFGAGDARWALLNSLSFVGYAADTGKSADVFPFLTALEYRHALGRKTHAGEQIYLNWTVGYTAWLDDLEFLFGGSSIVKVADEWEIGLAFSKAEHPLRLWRFSWDRLGLAYRFSSGGDFEGITIVFRSLYDR